ncbi:YwdI family protein [Evansella sp. AB-P1]|uniref:YwdI family protein n=1 Tax=Evansella sp. AB-P1 TaxID=3037653 RepID=UPI00241D11DB|nr:YwdI family protein [Evansella sp. AB-P1]MDG5787402.1 YwdI family protein [Evansella sp. AB-P1]
MDIPAKVVVKKMEDELRKLKASLEEQPNSTVYREQAVAIKTYCDLLLASEEAPKPLTAPKVQHATIKDVKTSSSTEQKVTNRDGNERSSIYDGSDEPESDSLLDF